MGDRDRFQQAVARPQGDSGMHLVRLARQLAAVPAAGRALRRPHRAGGLAGAAGGDRGADRAAVAGAVVRHQGSQHLLRLGHRRQPPRRRGAELDHLDAGGGLMAVGGLGEIAVAVRQVVAAERIAAITGAPGELDHALADVHRVDLEASGRHPGIEQRHGDGIRLLAAGTGHALDQVVRTGCRVWRSQGAFDHSKLMTVDDGWAYVGSSNLDPRSLRLNFELDTEIYDVDVARWVGARIDAQVAGAQRERLRHVADAAARVDVARVDLGAEQPGLALAGRQQAGQHLHGGGLAAAVRAQETEDLALADAEVDVIDRDEVPSVNGKSN